MPVLCLHLHFLSNASAFVLLWIFSPKGAPDSALMVFTIFLPPLCMKILGCCVFISSLSEPALSHPLDHHPKWSYLPSPLHLLRSPSPELITLKLLPMLLSYRSSLCHFIVCISQISHLPSTLHQFFPAIKTTLRTDPFLFYGEKHISQPQGRSRYSVIPHTCKPLVASGSRDRRWYSDSQVFPSREWWWGFLLLVPSPCSRKQVFLHRLAGLSTGHKRCTRWLTWAVARISSTTVSLTLQSCSSPPSPATSGPLVHKALWLNSPGKDVPQLLESIQWAWKGEI